VCYKNQKRNCLISNSVKSKIIFQPSIKIAKPNRIIMKIKIALLFIVAVILASCGADKKSGASESSTESVLATISVDDFEKKLSNVDVQLIDVRTAEEFSGGYLKGATNIDVNSTDFDDKIAAYR
jgi:hypothetical protein